MAPKKCTKPVSSQVRKRGGSEKWTQGGRGSRKGEGDVPPPALAFENIDLATQKN